MRYHRLAIHSAVTVLATAGALLIPTAAQAKTETASSHGVTATFSYHSSGFNYHDRITIARAGKVVYSAVAGAPTCSAGCAPGASSGKSVHVLDLAHSGTQDVILDLFTGGANCCFYEVVYYPSGSTYKVANRFFGNQGDQIRDLRHNGHQEFLSANPFFTGAFTDDAASGAPIQILTFSHGRFHDVTRSYRTLITKDAKFWLAQYKGMAKSHWADTEGVIADWAADEYMLGNKASAQAYLNAQAKAGHLRSPITNVRGHKFVVALQKFLKQQGY